MNNFVDIQPKTDKVLISKREEGKIMSAINQFDFYVVVAMSDKIKPFKDVGISRDRIDSYIDGYKVYGSGMYAKKYLIKRYKSSVGFFDASGKPKSVIESEIETCVKFHKNAGFDVAVKYEARD